MIVSEEIVDQTWKGVADYSPDEMIKEMQKFGEKQPLLLSFAMANSEEMRREVGELVLYLAFVVYKMFEKSYKLPVVSAEIIEAVDEKNYNSMETLAGENFLDELNEVLRYVTNVQNAFGKGEKRLDMAREKWVDGTDEFEYNEWLMDDYYLKDETVPHVLGKLLEDESLTSHEKTIIEIKR